MHISCKQEDMVIWTTHVHICGKPSVANFEYNDLLEQCPAYEFLPSLNKLAKNEIITETTKIWH